MGIVGAEGATLRTDVYFPGTIAAGVDPAAAPCAVIVLGHGFVQSKARHVNQGLHLATRGFIVLIPDFNGGSDHVRNGRDLSFCIDWILAENARPGSAFQGGVLAEAIGASGHSAGGLSAILAASADARIRALSLMDPVDNAGRGVAALPSIAVPVAMTWSEPSACNANGSAEVLYAGARGIRRGIKIVGANHSDPQDPAGLLSILTCGAPDVGRQSLYRRYMAGWFERYLRHDATYDPYVYNYPGGQVAADLAAGLITVSAVAPLHLSLTLDRGAPVLYVAGPSGQAFRLENSTNLAAWVESEIPGVGTAPQSVTNLPPTGRLFLRTRSTH